MFRAFALRLANLEEEFKLLRGIIVLLLLDTTVDHAVKGHKEGFIARSSSLIRLICCFILALKTVLVADLCLVTCIFRLKDKRHIEQLKCSLKHFRLTATETGKYLRNVENKV